MVANEICGVFFIGVLMLSVSCDRSMDSDNFENLNKIEFQCSDFKEAVSRGTETSNTTIDNFGVYAYYAEGTYDETSSVPSFLFNSRVSRKASTDSWIYDDLVYWPALGGISFFAYSPHVEAGDLNIALGSTLATTGAPQITYLVPDVVVNQLDLLISTPLYNQTKPSASSANSKVSIPFTHALSAITFEAKVDAAYPDYVKVKSITIGELNNKAKVSYTAPLSWEMSADATKTTYVVGIGNGLADFDISKTIEYTDISSQNGKLMLLPQVIDVAAKITVVVEMKINGMVTTRTSLVELSKLTPTLEAGMRYTIKVNILALADIDLKISVNPWESKVINVPDFN